MRKVYQGFIDDDDYGFLTVRETDKLDYELAALVQEDFDKYIGKPVFVRYFITDKENTENKAKEKLLHKLSGDLSVKYELEAYSEFTVLEWEQELIVGGHDLIKELESFMGKYLVLIIEEPTPPETEGTI